MKKTSFNPGKFKQWTYFKKKKDIIWLAGLNNNKYISNIFSLIINVDIVNLSICKKILKYLGNHFGIVIITPNWSFAAVDYSRISNFWTIKDSQLNLSAQANLLSKKELNYKQLLAFQMSGYTSAR